MSDIFELFRKIEKAPEESPHEPISFILAGLGNPGGQYTFTRHNAGFLTLDYISQRYNFKIDRSRFNALCGELNIAGRRGLVMKPQTYMNASGEAIRDAASFYKIPPEHIIVICDDINLAPGKIRLRLKGSDGGQRGLKSIIYQLASENFVRVRMGVGAKPTPEYDLAAWVLGTFPEADRKAFFSAVERVSENLPLIIYGNFDRAMNILN